MIDIIIPTYKPDNTFLKLIEMLQQQTVLPNRIILMNTEEEWIRPFLDKTGILDRFPNLEIHHVSQKEFDHGKTRHQGVGFSKAPYFLCMTQDAIPKDNRLIEELLKALKEEKVAIAYGRQLARKDSGVLETYTREFNYPSESRVKSEKDISVLGIKTYFCSNVCAAYNRSIYDSLGGFIQDTIFNEDMIYAANAIKAGYLVSYVAQARVIHSHSYTGIQQLKRNFDLGVSQAKHPEIFQAVPSEKEGGKMVFRIISLLKRDKKLHLLIPFFYQCACKLIGYRLGKAYKRLPLWMIKFCSMNQKYWEKTAI